MKIMEYWENIWSILDDALKDLEIFHDDMKNESDYNYIVKCIKKAKEIAAAQYF